MLRILYTSIFILKRDINGSFVEYILKHDSTRFPPIFSTDKIYEDIGISNCCTYFPGPFKLDISPSSVDESSKFKRRRTERHFFLITHSFRLHLTGRRPVSRTIKIPWVLATRGSVLSDFDWNVRSLQLLQIISTSQISH